MKLLERAVGCLIGSAYGDSLGAAVEFLTLQEIRKQYGPAGITRLMPFFGFPAGSITDDTQMAIATAEGLVNAPNIGDDDAVTYSIWQAYRQWYASQSEPGQSRAPGNTCLSALGSGRMGTIETPLNHSAGCGAIMRAHPVGVAVASRAQAYKLGTESGEITHGHPNGYVPSGFLAVLIAELMSGQDLEAAVQYVWNGLKEGHTTGTREVVRKAALASRTGDAAEIIDHKVGGGGGWHGHDALAISLYAVLRSPDEPLRAVEIAVNHSGDSDSTGAIAGAIMGALYGPAAFDAALAEQGVTLEHDQLLRHLAQRLVTLRERD